MLTDLQDRLILPGLIGFTKFGYFWRKRTWQPLAVSLRGRTAVVTGATSGLAEGAPEERRQLWDTLTQLTGLNRRTG